MSKLEELIARLCPDGVEYKTTNDLKITSFWLMPATPKPGCGPSGPASCWLRRTCLGGYC